MTTKTKIPVVLAITHEDGFDVPAHQVWTPTITPYFADVIGEASSEEEAIQVAEDNGWTVSEYAPHELQTDECGCDDPSELAGKNRPRGYGTMYDSPVYPPKYWLIYVTE